MNSKPLTTLVNELLDQHTRLGHDIAAIGQTDFTRFPENFIEVAGKATRRSENISMRLRQIVPDLNGRRKKRYRPMDDAIRTLGIEVYHTNNALTIIMPGITPTRAFNHKTEYLLDPLYHALSQYTIENQIPMHRKSVVVFTHIYNAELSTRRVKDYDNLECKNILDMVSCFALPDDSGLHCDVHHMLCFSDCDLTRIDVLNASDFAQWYTQTGSKIP